MEKVQIHREAGRAIVRRWRRGGMQDGGIASISVKWNRGSRELACFLGINAIFVHSGWLWPTVWQYRTNKRRFDILFCWFEFLWNFFAFYSHFSGICLNYFRYLPLFLLFR